jgi:hypothetical protein
MHISTGSWIELVFSVIFIDINRSIIGDGNDSPTAIYQFVEIFECHLM